MNYSQRVDRQCDQCPMEAVIGFYFQCKNPRCSNYDPPAGMAPVIKQQPVAAQKRMQLYARWDDVYIRDNKFRGRGADYLVGMQLRQKFNGHDRLKYGARFTGVFEVKPDPVKNAPDMVRIMAVKSNIIVVNADWNGYHWIYDANEYPLPL